MADNGGIPLSFFGGALKRNFFSCHADSNKHSKTHSKSNYAIRSTEIHLLTRLGLYTSLTYIIVLNIIKYI